MQEVDPIELVQKVGQLLEGGLPLHADPDGSKRRVEVDLQRLGSDAQVGNAGDLGQIVQPFLVEPLCLDGLGREAVIDPFVHAALVDLHLKLLVLERGGGGFQTLNSPDVVVEPSQHHGGATRAGPTTRRRRKRAGPRESFADVACLS